MVNRRLNFGKKYTQTRMTFRLKFGFCMRPIIIFMSTGEDGRCGKSHMTTLNFINIIYD